MNTVLFALGTIFRDLFLCFKNDFQSVIFRDLFNFRRTYVLT